MRWTSSTTETCEWLLLQRQAALTLVSYVLEPQKFTQSVKRLMANDIFNIYGKGAIVESEITSHSHQLWVLFSNRNVFCMLQALEFLDAWILGVFQWGLYHSHSLSSPNCSGLRESEWGACCEIISVSPIPTPVFYSHSSNFFTVVHCLVSKIFFDASVFWGGSNFIIFIQERGRVWALFYY